MTRPTLRELARERGYDDADVVIWPIDSRYYRAALVQPKEEK